MLKNLQIAIIGYAGLEEYPPGTVIPSYCFECAENIGYEIGRQKWFLLTGGKSGIMECAARGTKKAGGITIGVICGQQRNSSNQYTDIEVVANTYPTGEESILISMADVVIVCGGGAGTLQEICIAYRLNKPLILMNKTGGWADRIRNKFLDERRKFPLLRANNPEECLSYCLQVINSESKGGDKYGN